MSDDAYEPAIEVFYSYAQQDEALCMELDKHLNLLQRQKLIMGWHRRLIPAGTEHAQEIDTHLNTAQIILLLISADYLVSDYCYGTEMERAMQRHKAGEARVIPIILHPVDWRDAPFSMLQALPPGGKPVTVSAPFPPYDAAFFAIARGLRQVLEEEKLRPVLTPSTKILGTPTAKPLVWNIPYNRNPYFTGREALLEHLHDDLTRTRVATLTQPQAISGLGGIGKTQTVVEYAYRHHNDYRYILWINAASLDSLIGSFLELATLLRLPEREDQDQNLIVAAAKAWFTTHDHWLLIFDNADDLPLVEDFLPQGAQGHLLLTTRAQAFGALANGIEVEKMDKQESMLLLLRRAKVLQPGDELDLAPLADRAAAESIIQELDGLPLALDQAGAYIGETQCAIASYLEQYRTQRANLLQRRGGTGKQHQDPVAATWKLSFEQVEKLDPLAADLLRCCAFLAPDAIPEPLIVNGASELGPLLKPLTDDPSLLDEAIATLLRFSLVKRKRDEHTLSVHRLLQSILRTGMDTKTQQHWAERTARAVNAAFPDVMDYRNWPLLQQFLPHAQTCLALIDQWQFEFFEAGRLSNEVGYYLDDHARYTEAGVCYQRAIAIGEKTLGPEHPELAIWLNNLANLHLEQGKYEEAEPLYQRAIAINEKVLGPEHPKSILFRKNYAGFLRQRNEKGGG